MYGQWIFGSHQAAVQQSQISASQQVFSTAVFAAAAIASVPGGIGQFSQDGTHAAAIHQQQIVSASVVFRAIAFFPQQPILGLKRDFVITQQEQPLDVPSSFFVRTPYLIGTSAQTPTVTQVIANPPQYPLDQVGTVIFTPPPAALSPPPTLFFPQVVLSYPQDYSTLTYNYSDIYEPQAPSGPVSISLQPPTILGLEDPGVDPTTLLGSAQLRWSAVPGAGAYRVYINGVPQNPPVTGQAFRATGLVVGTQYKFAVVAVAAGIDDSPLSNEIYYEHGTNEFSVVYKYPYGNTFKAGYVLVVKLGTPV